LTNEKLAQFTRGHTFETILGDVRFGEGGGWSEARVLQVQYQNIDGNDLAQFKDARTQVVVSPSNLVSGTLVYPYAKAKRRV
jgi:branched-chain amino acid transport system substrate-binding protein